MYAVTVRSICYALRVYNISCFEYRNPAVISGSFIETAVSREKAENDAFTSSRQNRAERAWKQKRMPPYGGIEPGITGPESVVLPLHHSSVDFGDAKVGLYFSIAKKIPKKISYICFNPGKGKPFET